MMMYIHSLIHAMVRFMDLANKSIGNFGHVQRRNGRRAECISYCIRKIYIFNIVKEYDDIYIEVKKYLYREVCMTIDAKKIIPKLSVLLEEWKKLKEIRNWEVLILETYGSIIDSIGSLVQQIIEKQNS